MKQRLIFLLRFYLTTVLIFVMAKVVFMLCYAGQEAFTAGDVLSVVWHGLSLDLSTALYFLIIPLLLSAFSVWLPVPRWLFRGYALLVAVAFSLAFVADTSLYAFWQFKLDASCLSYLETPTEATASVSTAYLLVRFIIFAVVAAVIFFSLAFSVEHSASAKLRTTALHLLVIPLMIIGIRGGLSESTTNIGQVYFSSRQFLNHSAVNPVFSFLYSLGKSGDYIVEYRFFSDDECEQLTEGLFDSETLPADTLLTTTRPNIVLIIMESCGGQFTELGGHADITPRLNQLAHEGIYFTQCYANSWRTDRGVVSILSGYPAFPITSVMKVPEKSRKLPSIAGTLKTEGYDNSFLYGGDINFTNMRSYVMSSGYDHLTWKADYSSDEQATAKWGVCDGITARTLFRDIAAQPADSRWMKTWLTLSSHEPWDVPERVLDDEVYNAFHYLDRCVGELVDSLRSLPSWSQTLVVILPDHGYRYQGINETTLLFNHIPMIWVGGAVRQPRTVSAICNQSDLAATLLGQLQLSHSDFRFSRDVLSPAYRRQLAFHTYVEGMTVIDSTGFMSYDLAAQHLIAAQGSDSLRLLQLGRALLQLTSRDLKEK
jgi:phosphoglycerol transferase MdoB-like AlkP superfamily enzyme